MLYATVVADAETETETEVAAATETEIELEVEIEVEAGFEFAGAERTEVVFDYRSLASYLDLCPSDGGLL